MANGESNRCRCFDCGITTSSAKNASVWAHQLTIQAVLGGESAFHSSRYVTIRVEIRAATTPEVAESFPRAFGRKINRRNESAPIPNRTAMAHTPANAS